MDREDEANRVKDSNCGALVSVMGEFYSKNEFFDVTLQIGNRSFGSHRLLLMAFSKYFYTMFTGKFKEKNVNKEEPIVLHDVDAKAFELILHFMYFGDVDITNSDIYSVLVTADFLQLRSLYIEKKCTELIREYDGLEPIPNAIKIFKFFCSTKKETLTGPIREHIFLHLGQLSTEDNFESIAYEDLKELLQGYPLWMSDQDAVLTFVIGWVHQSRKNRKHHFTELVKLTDLQRISPNRLVFLLNEYEKLIDRLELGPDERADDAASSKLPFSPHSLIDTGNAQPELTITFVKYDFLAFVLEKSRCSSSLYVMEELPWQIFVQRKENSNYLGLFLQCNGDPENNDWKCYVEFKLSILSQENKPLLGPGHYKREAEHEFNKEEADFGWANFISLYDLIDPQKGFLKDNVVIFQAHMTSQTSNV